MSSRGDTTSIGYTIENVRSGGETMWGFLVEAPGRVIEMPRPARFTWGMHTRYRARPIAGWMMYADTLLGPGQRTPELRLVATGIPDLVRYWAVPDLMANPPVADDEPARDEYLTYSDTGTTVGVVAVPTGATAASLTGRLRSLLHRSCSDLRWIASPRICGGLDAKLSNASKALVTGQARSARQEVEAFLEELEAQQRTAPGKHVGASAYALLAPNARYLLTRF